MVCGLDDLKLEVGVCVFPFKGEKEGGKRRGETAFREVYLYTYGSDWTSVRFPPGGYPEPLILISIVRLLPHLPYLI